MRNPLAAPEVMLIGQVVHFTNKGGKICPAIIVALEPVPTPDHQIRYLKVFQPFTEGSECQIPYSAEGKPMSWCWPADSVLHVTKAENARRGA